MSSTISTNWPIIANDIAVIKTPSVAWETILRDFYLLTDEVAGVPESEGVAGVPTVPATFRGWVEPTDLNDLGADEAIIEIGFMLKDYFGQLFSIIAINEGGSIDVSDDTLCGYCPPSGRTAIIFNEKPTVTKPKPPDPPRPTVQTRWVDIVHCVVADGRNTGMQEGYSKKQIFNTITGLWEDTGEQSPVSRQNLSACPLPQPPQPDPYRAGQYTGQTFNPSGVTVFSFTFGSASYLNTISVAGRNYLFLSLPVGKSFKVLDGSGANITSKFSDISTSDNVTGYQNNKVWRKNPPYSSEDNVPFEVTIYN